MGNKATSLEAQYSTVRVTDQGEGLIQYKAVGCHYGGLLAPSLLYIYTVYLKQRRGKIYISSDWSPFLIFCLKSAIEIIQQ